MSTSFIFCIPWDICVRFVGTFWYNRQEDDKRGNWNSQHEEEESR